jgi:hypothetical protein
MKRATVYCRKGKIILYPSSKTNQGVWILSEPVCAIESDKSPNEIGEILLKVISESKSNVDHPAEWTAHFEPVLKLAGVKSLNTFNKSAKCVEIDSEGEKIVLYPTVNLGASEGFEPIDNLKVTVPVIEQDSLGSALLKAIECSK